MREQRAGDRPGRMRRALPAAFAMVAFQLCMASSMGPTHAKSSTARDEARALIHRHHPSRPAMEDIPRERGGLARYLTTLDPYSRYHGPREHRDLKADTKRGLGGLVAVTAGRDYPIFIPFAEAAAAHAGLRDPMVLSALDGQSALGWTPVDIARVIGSRAKVTVSGRSLIGGGEVSATVPVTVYRVPDVEAMEIGDWNVLRLHYFDARKTAANVAKWLASIANEPAPVVIDLRYTTGGSLFESIDTASLFSARAISVATALEGDGARYVFTTNPTINPPNVPIFLLIGPQTTSAGEVFARALAHHGLAITVGRPTFGKCLMQRRFALSDGAALTLTVGRLLDAAGRYCDGRGLTPDIPVEESQLHDGVGLTALVGRYQRDHRVVCLARRLGTMTAAIAEARRLAWDDGVGRLKPLPRRVARGPDAVVERPWRLCLTPPLAPTVAAAVARHQSEMTGVSMEVTAIAGPDPASSGPAVTFGVRLGSHGVTAWKHQRQKISRLLARFDRPPEVIWYAFHHPEKPVVYRAYAMPFDDRAAAMGFCRRLLKLATGLLNCQGPAICQVGGPLNPC